MGVALSDGSFPHRTRPPFQIIQSSKSELGTLSKNVSSQRPCGAMVARFLLQIRRLRVQVTSCLWFLCVQSLPPLLSESAQVPMWLYSTNIAWKRTNQCCF